MCVVFLPSEMNLKSITNWHDDDDDQVNNNNKKKEKKEKRGTFSNEIQNSNNNKRGQKEVYFKRIECVFDAPFI